jgi:hypothetical protein
MKITRNASLPDLDAEDTLGDVLDELGRVPARRRDLLASIGKPA